MALTAAGVIVGKLTLNASNNYSATIQPSASYNYQIVWLRGSTQITYKVTDGTDSDYGETGVIFNNLNIPITNTHYLQVSQPSSTSAVVFYHGYKLSSGV